MISGPQNIASIFSALHDGVISSQLSGKDGLLLVIDAPHLASRIAPTFTRFLVCLLGAEDVRFHTWPGEDGGSTHTLAATDEIFRPKLRILEGNSNDGIIGVACDHEDADCDYSGGELEFRAELATVSDEAGKFWTLDQLEALCRDYWDE